MKERVKQRIKRNITQAGSDVGSAVGSAAKGKFREAGSKLRSAGNKVKLGLFGQGSGKFVDSSNATVRRDGKLQPNTRNTKVVIGSRIPSVTQVKPKDGGMPELRENSFAKKSPPKTRNRSEAARKAALTRKRSGK